MLEELGDEVHGDIHRNIRVYDAALLTAADARLWKKIDDVFSVYFAIDVAVGVRSDLGEQCRKS